MVAEQEVDKLSALISTLWGYHKCLLICLTENTVGAELTELISPECGPGWKNGNSCASSAPSHLKEIK